MEIKNYDILREKTFITKHQCLINSFIIFNSDCFSFLLGLVFRLFPCPELIHKYIFPFCA